MPQDKENNVENRSLLIVIAVILIGIFAVVVVDAQRETPEEQLSESISGIGNVIEQQISNE